MKQLKRKKFDLPVTEELLVTVVVSILEHYSLKYRPKEPDAPVDAHNH